MKGRGYILCPAPCVKVWQKKFFFFNSKLNILSFIFLIWTEQFWIWFSRKLTKNIKIPIIFASFPLPPVWLLNLGSDLSVDNIVQLGLAGTKIDSQDDVKVLELTEKWKYQNLSGKFWSFFQKSVRNMTHHYNC